MKPLYRTYFKKWLFAALLLAGTTACEDNIENPTPTTPEEEGVQVELSFGFADEDDGYTASKQADTRSGKTTQSGAFSAELTPTVKTRETEISQPDALYKLYVFQFSGETLKKTNNLSGSDVAIGSKLKIELEPLDDCQLVVVAFGNGNTVPKDITSNITFSNFQKLTMDSEIFNGTTIPTSGAEQSQMNKMPYILYLPHVKVQDGKLQSPDGAYDTRLLLKRLATKLTVNWTMAEELKTNGYGLKEVKLCQVPADFRLLPAKEDTKWGTTYPLVVSEFVETYRLTEAELNAGKKTVWIPANARGTSAKATSDRYRTKENAPDAASYVELVVDNSKAEERLYYRAYLGGESPTDFNLYENTDYNWTLNINSANYREDGRIQLLDQIPVVSTNLVETSNCFMMQPGTNISFNPYKHEAGTNGWNTELVSANGGIINGKTISYVKVLWQTKDAGTSGDLVMGYVANDNNHKNLVNTTDIGDTDKARVHIKVPVTNGGNAVIAAYNISNEIVWSWHLWISDYIPVGVDASKITNDATRQDAIKAAQAATQAGMVQVYGGISWTASDGAFYKCVIMDRHLGATKAGIQKNRLDAVRTFGLLHQGGRKDPFFSTADGSKNEVKTIYKGDGTTEEIKRYPASTTNEGTEIIPYANFIKNPLTFYKRVGDGGTAQLYTNKANAWGTGGKKTIYDPCPKGWKVPTNAVMISGKGAKYCLFAGWGSSNSSETFEEQFATYDNVYYYNSESMLSITTDGGASVAGTDIPGSGFLYIGGSGETKDNYSDKSAFYPGVALREKTTGLYRPGTKNNAIYLWGATDKPNYVGVMSLYQIASGKISIKHQISCGYGFSVRCVQDSEQP